MHDTDAIISSKVRAVVLLFFLAVAITRAGSPHVRVENAGGRWQLTRGGEPYLIRGAGGDGSWELLAKLGGNSVRTWGHEKLGGQLDHAQKLGLTITAGIWLGQVRQGFDWSDAESLIRQRAVVRAAVEKHKDHPALLLWALGNEMEDPQGRNGAVWSELNNLARLVKSIDPGHPVMTVIAEVGGDKVRNLHALCPDIDIVGINSYAGAASVGERYRKLGGTKPYVLTEFGPPGIWEVKKDGIGAYREPRSTAKVEFYRNAYCHSVIENSPVCLGSFAFMWGQKQEVTATWFSLLLPDGSRLGAADALSELWTGKPVANRCPEIESLDLAGAGSDPALFKPGVVVPFALKAADPEGDPLVVQWELFADEEEYGSGGDAEAAATVHAAAVVRSSPSGAEVRMPENGGLYRVFATVRDGKGGAATANFPVRVDAPETVPAGKPATLPLIIYSEGADGSEFAPSGWMGDAKSIRLDPAWADKPQAGATCMRCELGATNGWGAVAWQHPAQDWGDRRGGFDLAGAKRLVFHARGDAGGEEVTFGFGIIAPPKRFFDTARRTLEKVRLTREWQRIEIALDDLKEPESLKRIKTGFMWSAAGAGRPVVFYLDSIRWE